MRLLLWLSLVSPALAQVEKPGDFWDGSIRFRPELRQRLSRSELLSPAELGAILSGVTEMHSSGITFSNFESDTHLVYRLLMERGEQAIPSFQRVLTIGTAAARLYACQGLLRLGARAQAEAGLRAIILH